MMAAERRKADQSVFAHARWILLRLIHPDRTTRMGAFLLMPIYEYHCEPCDHIFETLVRGSSDVARCPRCGNIDVAKQFSVPAAVHSGHSSSLPMCHTPDTPSFGCGGPSAGLAHCAFE